MEMKGFGKHSEKGLEREGAGAEEVHPRFDYGPVDEGDVVP